MDGNVYIYSITGGMLSIFIVILITAVFRKKKKIRPDYDERQVAARGIAYKNGFIMLWIWTFTGIMLDNITGPVFADDSILMFTTLLFCGSGIVVTCIWKDAYFPVNKKPFPFILTIIIVMILNVVSSWRILVSFPDSILTDGKLNTNSIHPLCFAFLLVILLNVIAKTLMERQRTIRDTKNEKS